MSDLHALPLMGHDLPEIEEISREEWLKVQKKARVFKSGPYWIYEHECAGRSGVPVNSYPMNTWQLAFAMAEGHMERCVGC